MPNYFYTDTNGSKKGPFDVKQLQVLVDRGIITPATRLETDGGHQGVAEQVPELRFLQLKSAVRPFFNIDIGFTQFITNTWISFIWILTIVAHVLIFLCVLAVMFANAFEAGFVTVVVGIPFFLFSLLFSRIGLESVVVLFRIETHLRSIREHYEKK